MYLRKVDIRSEVHFLLRVISPRVARQQNECEVHFCCTTQTNRLAITSGEIDKYIYTFIDVSVCTQVPDASVYI